METNKENKEYNEREDNRSLVSETNRSIRTNSTCPECGALLRAYPGAARLGLVDFVLRVTARAYICEGEAGHLLLFIDPGQSDDVDAYVATLRAH